METAPWRKAVDLETDPTKNSNRYSFIQALRHLRFKALAAGKHLFDFVRIRAELSLGFSNGAIAAIEKISNDPERFRVTATFLGMYGTGSPLPMFYTQELFSEQKVNSSVSRDFIDVFNGLLYEAHFGVWKKTNFLYSLFEDHDPKLAERLMCVAGVGHRTIRKAFTEPLRQVRYSGLSSRRVKSAEGLRTILADTLDGPAVGVEQCVTRMAPIPTDQYLRLGKTNNALGVTTVIGKRILDRMGSFRIHIGPVNSRTFNTYLPDRPALSAVSEQVRFYSDQLLDWDVEVYCKTRSMASVRLGNASNALLGWNTWVFAGACMADCVSARFKPICKEEI